MKKIKLLTISATSEIGGSDINLLRLLRSLDKNEYDILHLIPYTGPLVDEFINAGVKVEIVAMPRIRLFENPIKYIMIILKFFPTVFKIKGIIEDYKIDIVCTSSMVNLYGALAARLAHRPHILIAVEYLFILRPVSLYFYLFSEKIVCCSRLVSRMFKKSDKVKVWVRHPGVDLDEFNPQINGQNLRKELGVSGSLVSMITRLDKWKGVETFIKAAKYVEADVKFIIFAGLVMGKEKYLKRLKNLIRQLKLEEKIFIKMVRCVPEIIAASDIIVHASLRPEPFGLIIIDAMAEAKPVIASKRGGPLEIISDGIDGVLVEPGDPKVLAKAISNLLEDPKSAKEIGLRAREKVVKNFDLKEYAKSFDKIFKEAIREYSLKHTQLSIRRNILLKISLPLAKLLVPVPPKKRDINKDIIKKILVIQLFGMGDLICSLPLLEALKGYFNKSKITLLIDARLSEVANLMKCKDEIIGYERGILSKPRLVSKIRRDKYDMTVVLNPLFQGVWIAYLSQAKYRIGYVRDYKAIQNIEKLSCLLTHPILLIDKSMHDTQRYLEIARSLGIETACAFPKLNIPDTAKKWVDDFLRDNGIEEKDFIFGINPNATWESRCWDMDKFADVADAMIERYNVKVIFFGSSAASDMHRIDIISSSMKHKAVYAAGKTDIPRLVALLNRCVLFLTNDSGPMHLAAALGVDMIALFGPGDINKFGYKRENITNITTPGPLCKPCVLNYQYKDSCENNICMKSIKVDEVIQAVEKLMSNKK